MVLVNLSQPSPPQPLAVPPTPPVEPAIPIHSTWFSLDSIHDNERMAMAEFFPHQESIYREWRDWMIQTYRQRPKEYLSLTTCRRHLVGDVGALLRLHSFLEQWGLINGQADVNVNTSTQLSASQSTAPQVMVPPALQQMTVDAQKSAATAAVSTPTLFKCQLCLGECQAHYFTTLQTKQPAVIICSRCFGEGKHPAGLTSDDLHPVNIQAQRLSEPEWTEEESLRLSELIEESNEVASGPIDWDAVASKLGTGKTKEHCMLRFLQLPLLDQVDSAATWEAVRSIESNNLTLFPALGDNPVMATLLLLAQLVHPRVASAAAHAAINSLTESELNGDEAKLAATALGVAAARAKAVAEEEAKRTSRLRDMLIEAQLAKLKIKVNLLEALDRSLVTERVNLERERLVIFHDRVKLRKWELEHDKEVQSIKMEEDSVITELK